MTAARVHDPVTSHEAAQDAAKGEQASQDAVFALLVSIGGPVTAAEVEDFAVLRGLPFSVSRVRSALPELERKGLVRRAGLWKPLRGRRKTLWEVVK